jgi:hypothetical protein
MKEKRTKMRNKFRVHHTRPEEFAIVFAEPVHIENLWRQEPQFLSEVQPMREIVRHVVATERQHRKRIPNYENRLNKKLHSIQNNKKWTSIVKQIEKHCHSK